MLNLLDRDSNSAIINMFIKLKEIMSKELKESMRITPHWIETVNQEINITKRSK